MAELAGPFDDVGGDRVYTSGDFADFLDSFMVASGVVFGKENALNPSNAGTLAISMASGRCFKNGRRYKNTAALSLALSPVTSGSKRIDRLVVRFDPITSRTAGATIIRGVETTGTPSAPAIVSTTDVMIAQILIDNSSGTYAYTVTDEREICLVANVSNNKPVGEVFELAGRYPTSAAFPAIPMWDADHTFGRSLYPLAYDFLRGQKALFANGTEDFTVTNTGGVLTMASPTNDWKALVAMFVEELVIGGNTRYITVNGVECLVTAASSGTYSVTCGAAGSGTQTATVYPYRTGANQVTLFKDQGRATMSWDGVTYINGFRRRDRFQGHRHGHNYGNSSGSNSGMAAYGALISTSVGAVLDPIADSSGNGTPRTGTMTEPNSIVYFRYFWVGVVGS